MNRRGFLGGGLAAAAVAAWPGWLSRAFADNSTCDPGANPKGPEVSAANELATFSAAYRQAQRDKRSLVVLVVPESDELKNERGHAFGEWLNTGSDAQMAPLALCEVVCARLAVVQKLVPAAGGGDPLVLYIDPETMPASVKRLTAALPPLGYGRGMDEASERADERTIASRVALLGGFVRTAVGARLSGQPEATLAAQARAELRVKPPRGSRWASSFGCGTTIEGDKDHMGVKCGMGHVPARSSRFLYLYARAGR